MQELTEADLDQFCGTENFYQCQLYPQLLYTDGVQYLAEKGGAYWLIDAIASVNLCNKEIQKEEFQSWKLQRMGEGATLLCTDGNDHNLYTQKIEFTDFPLQEVTLFYENNVLYLPSER